MKHLYDRASMAHALTLDLEPRLRRLLTERITALGEDLIDWTEYLVVEPGDTEADIVRAIGFSPLIEPIDGHRYGEPGFYPHWDWLADRGGWYEMVVTFGSAFAYVLIIQQNNEHCCDLMKMCAQFATTYI